MKTDYTIDALQASILAELQACEPLTLAQLIERTGLSQALFTRAQLDLRLRLFATSEKTGIHRSIQLSITAQGTIALDAYRKKCELMKRQPVAPTRINLMAQPVWEPAHHGIASMLCMGTSRV